MESIEFAVKGLLIHQDKFLAVHRSDIASAKFELPGGRMNFGETAEETLKREMLEEVGLYVTPRMLVDTWNYIMETRQITGIIYLCTAENCEAIKLSPEHDHYQWLPAGAASSEKMNRLFGPQMRHWDWETLIKSAGGL
ncbi:MAG: NUDIX domain-containing protein [Defluviitaleaceae bacterium]|nr:NUDIX domain-containing protein [Defluviitaleaceae bacterium]